MAVMFDGAEMVVSPVMPWRTAPKGLAWTGDRVDFEGYSSPVYRCGKTGQLFFMTPSTDSSSYPEYRAMATRQDLLASWK